MITEERLSAFIRSYIRPESDLLEEIRKEAAAESIPLVRPETGQLLSFFAELQHPEAVMEVGTAVGYSALLMLRHLPEDAEITTIELDPLRAARAEENFRRAGAEKRIRILLGDAGEILPALEGSFGMIFMDAAKAQYAVWLPDILRLLAPGGLLISDNILQEGSIPESRYAVERRDRTIHKRMRGYLEALTQNPELQTVILPTGDGVSVTRKKQT